MNSNLPVTTEMDFLDHLIIGHRLLLDDTLSIVSVSIATGLTRSGSAQHIHQFLKKAKKWGGRYTHTELHQFVLIFLLLLTLPRWMLSVQAGADFSDIPISNLRSPHAAATFRSVKQFRLLLSYYCYAKSETRKGKDMMSGETEFAFLPYSLLLRMTFTGKTPNLVERATANTPDLKIWVSCIFCSFSQNILLFT